MSLKYRDKNGAEVVLAGLTPGGDIEAGAVMTRSGQFANETALNNWAVESKSITFDSPMPDADYELEFSYPSDMGYFIVRNKTTNGFTGFIQRTFTSESLAGSLVVKYKATKTYTIQHAQQNAEDIAALKQATPAGAGPSNKFATANDITRVEDKVEDISNAVSNPNLLDNPWFTVNQRRFNNISGGGTDSYRFDRWRGTYGYDAINNIPAFTGVQYAIQRFEPNIKDFLNGKLLTASVMYSDGTIESGTFTYYKQPSNWITVSNINKVYVQIGYNATASNVLNGSFCITNRNTDLSIKAVKVELGTISTLINDIPPNYQQELAKCQRYYYEFNNNDDWCPMGHGHFRTDSVAEVLFKHPVEMRTNPTIILSDINGVTMSYQSAGGTDIQPTSMTVNISTKREASLLFNTPNVATVNSCTEVWLKPDVPTKLTFSADL